MSVIRTDRWLLDTYNNPVKICEKLTGHFEGALAYEIYNYLSMHGMYRLSKNGSEIVGKLIDNQVWEIVQKDEYILQKNWGGPDIPVYIFPSDANNILIQKHFNGKSGLAFADKLFLFISGENVEKEIKSLFTHEYNHVCRLYKLPKKEEEYELLDTIILEGLAEHAVREMLGEPYVANWVSFYTDKQIESMWHKIVCPNRNLHSIDREYQAILYGLGNYPNMLGYSVGYYLVKRYIEKYNLSSKDLLSIKTSDFAETNYEKYNDI